MTPARRLGIAALLLVIAVSRGGCGIPGLPVGPSGVTAVVYVYEKDYGEPPAVIRATISKIDSEGKIRASVFEEDTTDGTGEVPEQYKVPLATARDKGFPTEEVPAVLVVMAGDKSVRFMKAPKTEQDVMQVVQ